MHRFAFGWARSWDPGYSTQEDFYNACYYSFRCCTTTGNGNGCYVSDNFGAMCRSCIKANSPRFVKKDCLDWLADDSGVDTSSWTLTDLMEDNGVPITQVGCVDCRILQPHFVRHTRMA